MNRRFTTLAAAAAALSAQSAMAAPVAVYTNGYLTGVDDLLIDGTAYNVDIGRASCETFYGKSLCDTPGSAFQFTQAQALAASIALNGFLTDEELKKLPGYNPATGNSNTFINTPYAVSVATMRIGPITKKIGENIEGYGTAGLGGSGAHGVSFRENAVTTYAMYSPYIPPSAPVPEPETWALMGVGVGVVGLCMRKRNRPNGIASRI